MSLTPPPAPPPQQPDSSPPSLAAIGAWWRRLSKRGKWGVGIVLLLLVSVIVRGIGALFGYSPDTADDDRAPSAASTLPVPATSDASTPSETPTPDAIDWVPPSDGVWPDDVYDRVGYGTVLTSKVSDYTAQITSVPMFSDLTESTVIMSQELLVTRVTDKWVEDLDEYQFGAWFHPGNESYPRHDEAYGRASTQCEADELLVGESTTCVLSFRAVHDEVLNSSWSVFAFGRESVAAWPGQQ